MEAPQAEGLLARNAKACPRAVHVVDEEVLEPVSLEHCSLAPPPPSRNSSDTQQEFIIRMINQSLRYINLSSQSISKDISFSYEPAISQHV
jgi:hypothetical protein